MPKLRSDIAAKVRELRKARGWTQAELSARIGLSQARLSEIENGDGSFSAEQFLEILRLFNVGVDHFVAAARDPGAELQNALVRLGAAHLQQNENALPSRDLEDIGNVLHAALISGEPRFITALAPLLVLHIEQLNLNAVRSKLASVGLQRRLDWLIDSTLEAVQHELRASPPRPWPQRYRRAHVMLEAALEFARQHRLPATADPADILDRHIRTKASLKEVIGSSSDASRRWGIVTALQPQDFIDAMEAARGSR